MINNTQLISYIYVLEYLLKDKNIDFLSLYFSVHLLDKELATTFIRMFNVYLRGLALNLLKIDNDQLNEHILYWSEKHTTRSLIDQMDLLIHLLSVLFSINTFIKSFSGLGDDVFGACVQTISPIEVCVIKKNIIFFESVDSFCLFIKQVFLCNYRNIHYDWDNLPLNCTVTNL